MTYFVTNEHGIEKCGGRRFDSEWEAARAAEKAVKISAARNGSACNGWEVLEMGRWGISLCRVVYPDRTDHYSRGGAGSSDAMYAAMNAQSAIVTAAIRYLADMETSRNKAAKSLRVRKDAVRAYAQAKTWDKQSQARASAVSARYRKA